MKGFTLLETAVVLAIISILTGLILVGWPANRQHQALLLATQQVQTTIRTAQQKALNEDRPQACLDTGIVPKNCSDVGVAMNGSQILIFADTQDPLADRYNVAASGQPGDYVIEKQTLPLGVTGPTNWQAFIFEATPPNIKLVGNLGADGYGHPQLHSGQATKDLTIKTYGQVE